MSGGYMKNDKDSFHLRVYSSFSADIVLVNQQGEDVGALAFKQKHSEIWIRNDLDTSYQHAIAIFFAVIQWLVKFCGEEFGNKGTYLAGAISGITDVDAITLSMAKMATGHEQSILAINTILLAALSNTLVKFIIVMTLGSMQLRKTAFIGFCSIFIVGLAYFFYRLFM